MCSCSSNPTAAGARQQNCDGSVAAHSRRLIGLRLSTPITGLSFIPHVTIDCTLPTFPLTSITLMPCGWIGLFVKMR